MLVKQEFMISSFNLDLTLVKWADSRGTLTGRWDNDAMCLLSDSHLSAEKFTSTHDQNVGGFISVETKTNRVRKRKEEFLVHHTPSFDIFYS